MDYARRLTPRFADRRGVPLRVEEIAEVGNIDHIAQHAPPLRFVIDMLIQAARIRRHYRQKRAFQVVGHEGSQLEFYLPGACPFTDGRTGLERNHADAHTGFEQAANFGLTNLSGTYHQALRPSSFRNIGSKLVTDSS